jgi:hypothetical protein
MTGPEHWREAETCARAAANAYDSGSLEDGVVSGRVYLRITNRRT